VLYKFPSLPRLLHFPLPFPPKFYFFFPGHLFYFSLFCPVIDSSLIDGIFSLFCLVPRPFPPLCLCPFPVDKVFMVCILCNFSRAQECFLRFPPNCVLTFFQASPALFRVCLIPSPHPQVFTPPMLFASLAVPPPNCAITRFLHPPFLRAVPINPDFVCRLLTRL